MNLCSCTILFVVLLAPENSSRGFTFGKKVKCIISLILEQVRGRFSVSCLHQSWALSQGKLWGIKGLSFGETQNKPAGAFSFTWISSLQDCLWLGVYSPPEQQQQVLLSLSGLWGDKGGDAAPVTPSARLVWHLTPTNNSAAQTARLRTESSLNNSI